MIKFEINRRGGIIGTGISFFPAFLLIVVLMAGFFIIAAAISSGINKSQGANAYEKDEAEFMAKYYPPRNVEKGGILEQFLASEVKIGGNLMSVEQAMKKACRREITYEQIGPVLREHFERFYSNNRENVFAFAMNYKLQGSGYTGANAYFLFSWFGGFNNDVNFREVSPEEFSRIYSGDNVEEKGICYAPSGYGEENPHILYIKKRSVN